MTGGQQLAAKSQLIRAYEANCGIDFPTDFNMRFREACEAKLAAELGLTIRPVSSIPSPSRPSRS